jgi:hypothetical protein
MKNDAVTKADLKELNNELKGEMTELNNELKGEMTELKNELQGEMTELKNELKGEMTELKNEFKGEMKEMREEIGDKFIAFSMKMEQNNLELKKEMNEKFDTVITTLDGLAGLISDNRVEKAAAESTFRRHEAKLDEHESRIEDLERKAV